MFRLTRQVRFAVSPAHDPPPGAKPANSYAGFPALDGLGYFFILEPTVSGPLDPLSGYLLNIKQIDAAVRELAIPRVAAAIRGQTFASGANLLADLFTRLRPAWPGAQLESLRLWLSPFLSLDVLAWEFPMVRLSQKFEFCASHRLHNPALSQRQNQQMFGKCNNPNGHGHNYELQVTVAGDANAAGHIVDLPQLERTVARVVIERFDHKNLNADLPDFAAQIPSVENIARVIYRLLKSELESPKVRLAAVTVWETAKTWCEYTE